MVAIEQYKICKIVLYNFFDGIQKTETPNEIERLRTPSDLAHFFAHIFRPDWKSVIDDNHKLLDSTDQMKICLFLLMNVFVSNENMHFYVITNKLFLLF